MSAVPDEDSAAEEQVITFATLVSRMARQIAEDLDRAERGAGLAAESGAILDEYRDRSRKALRAYSRAAGPHQGMPFLSEFYDRTHKFAERRPALIAALLAGTLEATGRPLLTPGEGTLIARSLKQTGQDLLEDGLPSFAEEAFDQAESIYSRFKEYDKARACSYMKMDAKRLSLPPGSAARRLQNLSNAFFGYGFRPVRLLIWMLVCVVVFTIWAVCAREQKTSVGDAIYLVVQNFVNPMGLGDVTMVSTSLEPVLVVETYTGDILRAIFFAMLLARWFRL